MIMGFIFATINQDGKLIKFHNTLEEAQIACKDQAEVSIRGLGIVDALNFLLHQELDLSKLQSFEKSPQ